MTKPRPQIDYIPIPYQQDASSHFLKLRALGKRVWLDSGKPWSNYGRYDILTAAPAKTLTNPSKDTLEAELKAINCTASATDMPFPMPFIGGLLGYFNYEYNHDAFQLMASEEHRDDLYPSALGVFHWALIQDHTLQKASLVFLPQCPQTLRDNIKSCLLETPEQESLSSDSSVRAESGFGVTDLTHDLTKEKYIETIQQIKELILAGDTYQINFSQRFSGEFSGREDLAYLAMRKVLPSPFCAYLELNEQSILSLSPERFIQVQNREAVTQPIKGTAPRGKTAEEDKALAEQLKLSEKNRAENLMIVDLLRNDFSQCCEPHSVKTPTLFELESFPNVHHLVSTVTGKIKADISLIEFFLKCFPGGSITGAPKKRSMEIIQALEEHPRNIYCGSILYLSAHGLLDSSITIRTILISGDKIYCWGGGGIVHDSEAEDEYQESIQKINVLIEKLSSAQGI